MEKNGAMGEKAGVNINRTNALHTMGWEVLQRKHSGQKKD